VKHGSSDTWLPACSPVCVTKRHTLHGLPESIGPVATGLQEELPLIHEAAIFIHLSIA